MDNINDIISSLSAEDIDMLKGVASSILGDQQKNEPPKKELTDKQNPLGIGKADFEMMMKAKNIFDRMNSASSKNTDLIMALKPHLSPNSQQKADQAIKILKLFEVLPYLKELF